MKPKQIKRYRIPAYPTKLQILADPELLERAVPPGWKTGLIAGAVTVFLTANATGCSGEKHRPAPAGTVVAPIFEHGDGRGSVGCVVITPPIFLSEEEALEVISKQLKKEGVDLVDKSVRWDVTVPRVQFSISGKNMVEKYEEGEPLLMDRFDPKRKVAVEYVSVDEYVGSGTPASAMTYDIKQATRILARWVREQGKKGIYFGAFYDPVGHMEVRHVEEVKEKNISIRRKKARENVLRESKELLRKQVRDFIDWLKAQGAI